MNRKIRDEDIRSARRWLVERLTEMKDEPMSDDKRGAALAFNLVAELGVERGLFEPPITFKVSVPDDGLEATIVEAGKRIREWQKETFGDHGVTIVGPGPVDV